MRRIVTTIGWILSLVIVSTSAGRALADAPASAPTETSVPPAKCFATPEKWAYDREHESLAQPGERFLADLRECDPTLAANITEAIRYQIQSAEAETFARHSMFVMAAYGVAWAFLAAAGLFLYLRQKRLDASIDELTARLRAAAGTPGGTSS